MTCGRQIECQSLIVAKESSLERILFACANHRCYGNIVGIELYKFIAVGVTFIYIVCEDIPVGRGANQVRTRCCALTVKLLQNFKIDRFCTII